MNTFIIIIIMVLIYLGFLNWAKDRQSSKEKERASYHLPATAESIERSLDLYFLQNRIRAKEMTDFLKGDGLTIKAVTYTIENGRKSSDTFLAVKENLKKYLNYDGIFPDTLNARREIAADGITEYMEFFNNQDCLLMITLVSNDRYFKGHHTVVISLLKKPYNWKKAKFL